MKAEDLPIPQLPYIKGKGFNPAPIVTDGIPDYADGSRNPKVIGTPEYEIFWNEQIYRCINGYQTGGIFLPGRFYYYMNFNSMLTVNGVITPDYCDLHLQLCYIIEWCKAHQKNLIIGKKRRAGISEFTQKAVVDYGFRFREVYQAGVAAGQKKYAEDFMTKWSDSETLLVSELKVNTLLKNTEEVTSGYIAIENGKEIEKNNGGKIFVRTMHTNPNMFKGLFLNDVIAEECGEFDNLCEFLEATEDCLVDGDTQVGTFFIYGCVCAGTKVWNNRGELVNIEDLKHEDGIIGFNQETGEYSKETITYWQPPAEKKCYRITTHTGRILECSEDHPILMSRLGYDRGPHSNKKKAVKFIETKDLKLKDQIAVINSIDLHGVKEMWHPRLVGWLIGDGSYGFDKTPRLSNCDYEINKYIDDNFDVKIERTYTTKLGKEYRETRIKGICQNLRDLGIYGQTKLAKRLPIDIHSYTKNDICELLGGFFDTDGCVCLSKTGAHCISLTSSSYDLLHEVRLLAQKLGIHCNISTVKPDVRKNPKNKNPYYKISINDRRSTIAFYENIKFAVGYKQDNLKVAYNDAVGMPTHETVKGLRFERLVKLEEIGMKPIYNLTAGTTNTYVANGIVTHNTGGRIEKGSKDFKTVWENPDEYNCVKFLIAGDRFKKPFYGGATRDGKDISETPNLLKHYKPYQIIGCEDREAALEHIEKKLDVLRKGKLEKYLRYRQNNPLNEADIFTKTGGNNFDIQKLNDQSFQISCNKPRYSKWKLEFITDENGVRVEPLKVKAVPAKDLDKEDDCVLILDGFHPAGIHQNLYTAGIDAYNQHKAPSSKSKGAMVVIAKKNSFGIPHHVPLATIFARPIKKEMYYEMCVKLSIYYGLVRDTLGDKAASDGIIRHYKDLGCTKYLAPRPQKFESDNSQQVHEFWVSMNMTSRPMMTGLLETAIDEHCENIWFPQIINQAGDFDVVEEDGDNDLIDAWGIALIQAVSNNIPPKDKSHIEKENPFSLGGWRTDANGEGIPTDDEDYIQSDNPQKDSDRFGL